MSIMDKELYDSAKSGKKRAGQHHLIHYLEGKRLTQREAIQAKCYDCSGMGEETECELKSCTLWPYSSYGGLKGSRKRPVSGSIAKVEGTGAKENTKDGS